MVINIKAPHGGVLSNGQVVTMTKERTAEAQKAVFETVMGVTLGVEGFYTGTGIYLGPGGPLLCSGKHCARMNCCT